MHLDQPAIAGGFDPAGEHRPGSLSDLWVSVSESVADDLLPLPDGEPPRILDLRKRERLEIDGPADVGVHIARSEEDHRQRARGERQREERSLTDVAASVM